MNFEKCKRVAKKRTETFRFAKQNISMKQNVAKKRTETVHFAKQNIGMGQNAALKVTKADTFTKQNIYKTAKVFTESGKKPSAFTSRI